MTNFTWKEVHKEKVWHPQEVKQKALAVKNQNKKLVTLNGSFDLLHAGHLHMFYEAKKQGDFLLVALNSDASIKQYKSPFRPIISLPYRIEMVAALSFVDAVTYFEELDPCAFLMEAQPHVHVNGSEYGENCIEAPTLKKLGAKLHIVALTPNLSTSLIVKNIKNLPE